MKIIKYLLRIFVILFVLFLIAASIYIKIYGKSLVENALNYLKRNVVIGKASYHFPMGISAQNVQIARSLEGGEFLRIRKIVAQFSPEAVYQRKFAFNSVFLIEPELVVKGRKGPREVVGEQLNREGEKVLSSKPGSSEEGGNIKTQESISEAGEVEISIEQLIVQKGRLQYTDGLTEKGFSFDLEDVQLKAKKLTFPLKEGRSQFKIAGLLIKQGNPLSGSYVQGSGWVDVVKRDMDAKIEVVEANGTVGLTAEAVSRDNDMDVKGEIKMQNLLQGIDKQASSDAPSVNDLVLNALSSAGVEIGAKFAFKTKMDQFRIGQVSFSGNVVTK